MSPDLKPTKPSAKPVQQTTRRSASSTTLPPTPALDALSAATGGLERGTVYDRSPLRRPSVLLAAVTGVLVGAAVLAGGFRYRCAATFRIPEGTTAAQADVYRKELLDFAAQQVNETSPAGVDSFGWTVDVPGEQLLRLSLVLPYRKNGVERVRRIAEGFRSEMHARLTAEREEPGEAENILTDYVTRLSARRRETAAQADLTAAALSNDDPSRRREHLTNRWDALRFEFDATRKQRATASATLSGLQSEADPQHGVVSAKARQRAHHADLALQQDLAELAVNLSELKLHLLNVWQNSSGPLERLITTVDAFKETASGNQNQGDGERQVEAQGPPITLASQYRQTLEAFSKEWDREFTTLRRLRVDPLRADVLHVYQRVQRRLNDFLFDAGKRLGRLRAKVQSLARNPRDTTRHHVFQSNLVRSFHEIQAAHHRFEFAADTIETPDNFRLDAALKATRGLRRRSQARVGEIEQRLQLKAAGRARKLRIVEIAETHELLRRLRAESDKTVDGLMAIQEELRLTAQQAEAFFHDRLTAEIAATRLKLTAGDLDYAEGLLGSLAAKRMSHPEVANVEIVSCGVIGGPVNLSQRLRVATLAAFLTAMTVLLAQWWMTRRT